MATLEVRVKDFITAVGTDWKNIWAKIGGGTLDTTATDLIGAINEVKSVADAAEAGTAPDATTSVKGIVELATDAEAITGTDTVRAVTPHALDAALDDRVVTASTTVAGISERATDSEALALAATDLTVTPANLAALRGATDGLASLVSGKVPSAQLPAFVDDVLESANLAAFPGTGSTGIIYVALDTNKAYRWSGSAYVEISPSPGSTDSVTEGSTNLYFTNTRADARADARITAQIGNPDADLAAYYTAAKA